MRGRACVAALAVAIGVAHASPASADVAAWNFESGLFTIGAPFHGQGGWSMTGPPAFDVAVVGSGGTAGFGSQSLRASNAAASGGFANQPIAPSLADAAGEASSRSSSGSSGDRQPRYDLRFQFRSAQPGAQQAGLVIQLSATDHLGNRMGVLTLQDTAGGLEVRYFDTPSPACPGGTAGCVSFRETTVVGGLTRGDAHSVRLQMDFVDGPDNDVVQVFVDGSLRFTGETWENYYRNDPEQAAAGNIVPLIDTAALRMNTGGGPAGGGFLIDNVRVQTTTPTAAAPVPTPPGAPGGGAGAGASTPTPMRILSAGFNRRTGIVVARLLCPPEAGQCSASVTVRGDGNVLGRRDLVRSAGKRTTIHLRLTTSRAAKLRRAGKATIMVFSRNRIGVGSRIRQLLPRQ
jgi:hypothetical protein